jgi:hypothetical protein
VSGDKAVELNNDLVHARYDEGDEQHEVGRELRGDGDEVNAGLLAALVLGDTVSQGHDQGGEHHWPTVSGEVSQELDVTVSRHTL